MKKYILEYIDELEKKELNDSDLFELNLKISYFQYERLIHLLVTISFAIFTIIFLILGMISYLFLIPFFILIIFLIFYIIHYFFLENKVQYLYHIYDKRKDNH